METSKGLRLPVNGVGGDWIVTLPSPRFEAVPENDRTSAAAYARFAEAELGTIEVGKRADLTAFSVDLMTAPEAEIPKGHAVLTVVDGKIVHRKP